MAKEETPTLRDAEEAWMEGDAETALAICDGLIPADETRAPVEVLYLAARCLLELEEPVEAEHLCRLALRREPDDALLVLTQGLCLFDQGKLAESHKWFERSAQDDELGEPLYYLGVLAERRGEMDQAELLFRAAVDRDPENLVLPTSWSPEQIKEAYDTLVEDSSDEFGEWLAVLKVEVEDLPSDELLAPSGDDTMSPLVQCLFEGEPVSEPADDATDPLAARPDRVVLFARNLGKTATDDFELQQEVAEGVLWETLRFLNLSETRLSELALLELADDDEELHPHS